MRAARAVSDGKRHGLIGRRVVPDWRMAGRSRWRGPLVSVAIHGSLAVAIALALGLPFESDPPPEPPQFEVRIEDPPEAEPQRPRAEPKPQEPARPTPQPDLAQALRRLAQSVSETRGQPRGSGTAAADAAGMAASPAAAQTGRTTPPVRPGALPPPASAQTAPAARPEAQRPEAIRSADADQRPVPAQVDASPAEAPQADASQAEATVPESSRPEVARIETSRQTSPQAAQSGILPSPSTAVRPPAFPSVPVEAPQDQVSTAPTRPAPAADPAAAAAPRPPEAGRAEQRRPARLDELAAQRRAAAAQDIEAIRAATARTQSAAAVSEELLRQLAARLKEMMDASSAQWARDQVERVDDEARAAAARAGRAVDAAAANAATAETLAAEMAGDPSAAAVIRQADAIATARGRTEQAAQAAESSSRQLAALLAVHRPDEAAGHGTPPDTSSPAADSSSASPALAASPDAGPSATAETAPEPDGKDDSSGPPADQAAERRASPSALQATRPPAPVLTSANGPPSDQVGAVEAGLQRGVAQATAAAWLGDRIERMVRRLQGDPSSLSSPDARVAMRALEMRQRNLDSAAADLVAALQAEQAELRKARQEGRPPAPQREARLQAANAAFVETARSVAAAMEPVLARLPKEEADWARVMRDSFDWLVEQRRREAERPLHEAASRPPPDPTPHQKRVLEAAREANPALPPVDGPRAAPLPQGLQAALNAARLNHIAQTVRTPSALYNLANALLNADGVARAPQQAAAIMKDLAEDGYRPAQLRMAEIAMLGDGQPADPAQALAWYRIAALRGSTAAQKAGAAYAVELSPEVRAEAERILAQWLAMHGPDTKPGQDELDRNLAKAIERQDYAEVERLLKEGADPQSLDDTGRTALVGASWRGRRNIVRLLMEHGVMTDLRDADNRSALLWSAINGYPQIADDLLDFGANVDITDAFGATPLIRAAWNGKYAVAERLLAAGADAGRRDSEGRSAIDRAAANGDARMLRLLGARPGQL